jgi:hypothetical protein
MSEDKERSLENLMICVKERDHGHDKHFSGVIEIYPQDNHLSFHRLFRRNVRSVFDLPCGRGLSGVRVVPPSDICGLLAMLTMRSEGPNYQPYQRGCELLEFL